MLEEAEEIGKRARRARLRLGMPQADLATALGKSQGWVSKMERGLIELDRVGLLNQVAAELHIHPNDLIGRPYSSSPDDSQWQIAASSILRELRRYDLVPVFDGVPRPASQLWREVTRLHRLRDTASNVAILRVLPDLFREARAWRRTRRGTSGRRRTPSTPCAASSRTPPRTPSDTPPSWWPWLANGPRGQPGCREIRCCLPSPTGCASGTCGRRLTGPTL